MTQLAETISQTQPFAALARQTWDGQPHWLDTVRRAALDNFEVAGFPTTDHEEWRFTSVRPIVETAYTLASTSAQAARPVAQRFSFGHEAALELVFVNGRFAPELSILLRPPAGVQVGNLADGAVSASPLLRQHLTKYASEEGNPFVSLNTAFLHDGAFVHLSRGAVVRGPIHLLFITAPGSAPTMVSPRVLVVADDGAQAQVVESYVGEHPGKSFTNAVTELVLGRDARIDHCRLQQETLEAQHLSAMHVRLDENANFVSHAVSLGAKLSRNDLRVILDGRHAEATLNGLVIIGGDQHCDNHTLLKHEKPDCPSHELYKHVLADKAVGIFKGKIYVQKGANGTDSKQTSKSLLLSDEAMMESMPALEIYADDVKCTHGSTTGPIDEEMVFYLRSRGVGLEAARHLLSYAFAADVTRRIKVEPVRRRVEDFLAAQHGLPQDLRITDLGTHDAVAL